MAIVIGLLFVAAVPLALLSHQPFGSGTVFLVIAFAAVGGIVAWRQPENAIRVEHARRRPVPGDQRCRLARIRYSTIRQHDGSLPLGWLAVLVQPTWAPAVFLFALSIMLFPDGELPSGRWRWPLGVLAAAGTVWLLGAFAIAVNAIATSSIAIEPGGDLVAMDYPSPGWAWWQTAQTVFFLLLAGVGLAVAREPCSSLSPGTGERRQQLKWLVAGGMVAVVGGVATVLLSTADRGIVGLIGRLGTFGLLGVPIAIGVGILKYRLYDIDQLISRTLSYTLLTGALPRSSSASSCSRPGSCRSPPRSASPPRP